jgi:hypothetical protein
MEQDYYKVFIERNKKYGSGFAAAVQTNARMNFESFLQSSPNSIEVTVNDSVDLIRVGTILEKENETENIRYFLSRTSDHLQVGDFIHWQGTTWLLYMKTLDVITAYDKFEAVRCSHTLSWINSSGILKTVPVYLVAQTDEKIKSNFRTWNNMITPQPNKFMSVMTTRRDIELGQKFLVDGTAWYVVESDYISVPNILYLSLTEDKVDMYIDDIENNIANIIDLNKIVIKTDTQVELATNQEFVINAHTELNDNLYDTKLLYTILNGSQYISLTDNVVKGIIEGQAQIKVYVENNPDIYTIIDLSIRSDAGEKVSYYIKGDGSIKWGRTKTYGFYKSINGVEELIDTKFEIEDNEELLLDAEYGSANAILTANKNNNVGTVVLKTTYNDIVYSKEIKIVSLWM